jgi:hypothetical protein
MKGSKLARHGLPQLCNPTAIGVPRFHSGFECLVHRCCIGGAPVPDPKRLTPASHLKRKSRNAHLSKPILNFGWPWKEATHYSTNQMLLFRQSLSTVSVKPKVVSAFPLQTHGLWRSKLCTPATNAQHTCFQLPMHVSPSNLRVAPLRRDCWLSIAFQWMAC